jgi:hypothetical protein
VETTLFLRGATLLVRIQQLDAMYGTVRRDIDVALVAHADGFNLAPFGRGRR